MIYQVVITGIGEMALDFLQENMLIIFNDNAPKELAEISIIHEIGDIAQTVTDKNEITFCDKAYSITAIGSEANHTLKTLGHCTFVFDGATSPLLPGAIHLKGDGFPDVVVGGTISIK